MPSNVSRFCCATKMVTASEAREPDAYRDCSNRLLDGTRRLSHTSRGSALPRKSERAREVGFRPRVTEAEHDEGLGAAVVGSLACQLVILCR